MTKNETKKLFLDSLKQGYDIEFSYNDVNYGVVRPVSRWVYYVANKPETSIECETPEEILNCLIDGHLIEDVCQDFIITYTT